LDICLIFSGIILSLERWRSPVISSISELIERLQIFTWRSPVISRDLQSGRGWGFGHSGLGCKLVQLDDWEPRKATRKIRGRAIGRFCSKRPGGPCVRDFTIYNIRDFILHALQTIIHIVRNSEASRPTKWGVPGASKYFCYLPKQS